MTVLTARWSDSAGSLTTTSVTKLSSDLVIIRSKVCPFLCVEPFTCCFKLKNSIILLNLRASVLLIASKWKLKSESEKFHFLSVECRQNCIFFVDEGLAAIFGRGSVTNVCALVEFDPNCHWNNVYCDWISLTSIYVSRFPDWHIRIFQRKMCCPPLVTPRLTPLVPTNYMQDPLVSLFSFVRSDIRWWNCLFSSSFSTVLLLFFRLYSLPLSPELPFSFAELHVVFIFVFPCSQTEIVQAKSPRFSPSFVNYRAVLL